MVALHASASVAGAGEATYAARLTPTRAGAGASGEVEFSLETNRANQEVVVVRANVRGLTPGKHGINVHENGDVSGCDDAGACTGKSYNPDKRPHHGPTALKKFGASACHFVGDGCVLNRHIGDLGNIVADENGDSTTSFKDLYTTLKAGTSNSIAGRSVVIRATADDFETEEDDGGAGPIVLYGSIVRK
jgi:Cu-Zn family superoxide dismutase